MRSWRSWATLRGTLRSMTRQLDTTRMHCHLTRPISMIFSLSAATRYGSYFTSHRTVSMVHTVQVIEVDPLSHSGYEGKHAALHGVGHHSEAFEAFRMMLSKLEQSPDPKIRGELFCEYYRQQRVLISFGQHFVLSMSTQLPRFKMWSSRLSATCHVCSSTLLPDASMTEHNKQQLPRSSRSTMSCGLQ